MATRYNINDFALANPAYVGATVSFYTVSGGVKTTTLATLYAASTGATTLTNPRTLDSDGKFSSPVYVEVPVIATVSGLSIDDHDTGIMGLAEGAAATSAAAAAVSAAAALVSENNAETAETNAETAQAAAEAAAASVGMRAASTVGGTADAITATFSPVFANLAAAAGIVLAVPVAGANTSTTPSIAIDGLTAKTIVKNSDSALVVGDIPGADSVILVVYDASIDKFQLLNPSGLVATASVAAHATTMNLWAAKENVLTGGAVTVTDIVDAPYAGAVTWVKMNAAHVWDDGAVFNVQGGADYTAAADDWIRIYATTVSTFEITVFKANGTPTAFAAGTVLQVVSATDVGSNTAAATLTNITSGVKQITPKSSNSTLIVECTFDATVSAGGPGQNTTGVFQLYNNTAAANIGQQFSLGAVSGAGADVQSQASGVIRALVTNSALTAIDFILRAKYGTAACTVTGANHVWTITEVQN